MHANSFRPDDLNDLERRLSTWQPDEQGLHADAMLFAAGQSSATSLRSRLFWPTLTGVLALTLAGLASWLVVERSERMALTELLRQQTLPIPPEVEDPLPSDTPSQDTYLPLRNRALDSEADPWRDSNPAPSPPLGADTTETSSALIWLRDHLMNP
jgi:hypothetical protein